jgi:alpha-L-rhamnosidase
MEDTINRPCPVFKKEFNSAKQLLSASVLVTSHGLYEAEINGKKVGDALLTPGWTDYDKRLQYQRYDVTDLVKKGVNTVLVTLASGWYRGYVGWENKHDTYGKTLALLFQIELTYKDGSKEIIGSDDSWVCSTGTIRYAELYNGETIDARKDPVDWKPVKVVDYGLSNLVPTISEPVRTHEIFAPVKIFRTPSGDMVADFGQNLAGWIRLKVRGKAGDTIKIGHAEVLDKSGNFYTASLRLARAEDIYVLKGVGEELFEPHFTYHGFRYVRLRGFRQMPKLSDLTAVAIYSDMPQTGSFECSNGLLNQLQHNILWSLNSNFVDIPTDCPQRDERLGWTGDAQVFCRTAAFNRNVDRFFSKWLKDVEAAQLPNGAVPQMVPDIFKGWAGSAGWGDVITVVPSVLYEVYGDKRVLEEAYPHMKAWVNFMTDNSVNGLWNKGFQFGDWLSYRTDGLPDRSALTDNGLVAQAYFAYSTQLVINAGKVLGHPDDVAHYEELLVGVKAAFLREYLTRNGRLASNTQTAYTLALQFDLLPDAIRAEAARRLAENVLSYNYHLTTGFLGTPFICGVLSRFGYDDVAYKLLLQDTYPSWLYPVKMGATTIWERWDGIKPDGSLQDPAMNSFNHYAYGAIGDFLYETVAGIKPSSPGYKTILIEPHPGGGLTFANASLVTGYGKVSVNWKIENGKFKLDVELPLHTTSEIRMPGVAEPLHVGSGKMHFETKTAL